MYMKNVNTKQEFLQLMEDGKPVVLDFYANWCHPCLKIMPVVEQFSTEYAGQVDIRKVDVDKNHELAELFGIRSIPTLIFFKHAKVYDKLTGVAAESVIREKLAMLMA